MSCDTELAKEMRVVLGRHTTDVLWPLPGAVPFRTFQLPDDERLRLWREKSRLSFNVNEHSFPQLDAASLGGIGARARARGSASRRSATFNGRCWCASNVGWRPRSDAVRSGWPETRRTSPAPCRCAA